MEFAAVRTEAGDGRWLRFDVVFVLKLLPVKFSEAGEVQNASHLRISDVKNPRQQNCTGELKRQEQILGMVRHLLETIALIELDCGVFRINDKANTTNTRNTSRSVNDIKEHELSNTFSLMGSPQKTENKAR